MKKSVIPPRQIIDEDGKLGYEPKELWHFYLNLTNNINDRQVVRDGPLTAGNANAYAFNWQNPHNHAIIITRIIIDITTAGGTATSVINVGSASGEDTASDNLIDGADLNAVAVYDNIDDQGTNGESKQRLDAKGGTTDWITGQILTANAASLVGNYYIYYIPV